MEEEAGEKAFSHWVGEVCVGGFDGGEALGGLEVGVDGGHVMLQC